MFSSIPVPLFIKKYITKGRPTFITALNLQVSKHLSTFFRIKTKKPKECFAYVSIGFSGSYPYLMNIFCAHLLHLKFYNEKLTSFSIYLILRGYNEFRQN